MLGIVLALATGSVVAGAAPVSSGVAPSGAGAGAPSFAREILPLLSDHCFACHGPDEGARKGGLRLDTRDGALGSSKSGHPAVVPGRKGDSEFWKRLTTSDADERMPPEKFKKPLSPAEIDLLGRWIDAGAPWGKHWAYETPVRPPVPRLATAAAPGDVHPIDAFIRARLAREGLDLSEEAPRETLLRRVTLALTGLPPAPEEVDAFVTDAAPDAYERVVDRLLSSPRYGERMAWEWLEAARYADSNGYQGDAERTMWAWRDWVVEAFNRNLPFDEFTVWQLAGDLLPDPTFEQRLATGFLRNHAINGEGGRIPEENRIDYLFDQTETVGTVWLGATLNCSRCHNHKFDPITQRDYFSLLAFFNRTSVDGGGGDPQTRPNLEVPSADQVQVRERLSRELAAAAVATEAFESRRFPRPSDRSAAESAAAQGLSADLSGHLKLAPARRDANRLQQLATHFKTNDAPYAVLLESQRRVQLELDALIRTIPKVMVMQDQAAERDTFILQRGLYTQPGARTSAAWPTNLGPATPPGPTLTNRLALARWLVDPSHPLTARVTVNRLWQSFFGVGLVKTAEDFGIQGERPSHPELLDWLATEFVASGWNVKALVRRMVTSRTFRQSSRVTPALLEVDPDNRLLARGPRHRLPSWMIRDAALAASGLLSESVGGPPVRPYQPPGVWEEATFGNKRYRQDHGADLYRRSLYVFWRRIVAPTMFFDVANRATCTVRTPRTNVPLHALLTLNDTTYVEAARALAQRMLSGPEFDTASRLRQAGRRVLGRSLLESEVRVLEAGLVRHRRAFRDDPGAAVRLLSHGESPRNPELDPVELAAWTMVGNTMLNLDEALSAE